jgi:hypothetical protein
VPQGNGIRRSKDLRARFRKFLILTNERKKMSKSTLRKRLSLVVISALTAGTLSVASAPVASAHGIAIASDATNIVATQGTLNGSMFVAMKSTTTTTTVAAGSGTTSSADVGVGATSRGLLAKDTSSGTAQTATALAGAVLSLYASVNTATAFTVTGGTLSNVFGGAAAQTTVYANDLRSAITTLATVTATGTAAQWTLPTTPGTYTVNLLTGFAGVGATFVQPSYSVGLPPTLSGAMTVTVVAASAGGTYSAANSACNTAAATTAFSAGVYPIGIDSTATKANGDAWSIDYSLRDAYDNAIPAGALTATATNGAFINFGTSGTTPTAGTTSTIVSTSMNSTTVRVDQPTAGAPLTTTVTISFNGAVICTKTVTIRGTVDKLTVANVGTQDLSGSAGSEQWMYQEIGLWSAGLFTVLATDSAGNIVATPTSLGAFSMDSATTTPTIQGLTFPTVSSSNSSTSTSRFTLGSFTCGAVAGSGSPVVVFTAAATGKITKSAPFTARCADNASTYSASFDKASYNNGDIATLTVKFLDSKGNAANNVVAYGASSITVPMMTAVSSASATSVTKADGTLALTYTVGLAAAAATAGTYAGVVTFTTPALGTTQALKYSIVDQAGTVSNAEVLKSIVALIASINKQIAALQKLILQRR